MNMTPFHKCKFLIYLLVVCTTKSVEYCLSRLTEKKKYFEKSLIEIPFLRSAFSNKGKQRASFPEKINWPPPPIQNGVYCSDRTVCMYGL